jgi:2-keto-4-pentenoate hydratase
MAADDPKTKVEPGMRTLLDRRRQDLSAGAISIGWKMGMTAPGVQKALGLDGPVVGYLTNRTAQQMNNGEVVAVDLGSYSYPALEVEVAITVGPGLTVAALAPALELVDLDVDFQDIVAVLASNVCHKAVLFGPEQPVQDITGLYVEVWPTAGGATEPLAEGHLTEAPGTTIAVARAFLAGHGAQLRSGDRVIAGSITTPLSLTPSNDQLTVRFGVLGELRVSFS